MIALRPLALRGIFHNLIARDTPEAAARAKRKQGNERIEEVICYKCLECSALHDDEDEAMDCCAPDAVECLHDQEVPDQCPVCGQEATSPHEAADCCLWKDVDHVTRWKMADQVEAGATWAEVLGVRT
jgi:hypothetical protein